MLQREAGYSLVELVLVIVILATIGVLAGPRFFNNDAFAERGYYDELASALRYAQKVAVASGCPRQDHHHGLAGREPPVGCQRHQPPTATQAEPPRRHPAPTAKGPEAGPGHRRSQQRPVELHRDPGLRRRVERVTHRANAEDRQAILRRHLAAGQGEQQTGGQDRPRDPGPPWRSLPRQRLPRHPPSIEALS